MKNLWLFLVRFNAFFWFLFFFTFSIILVVRNNQYQQTAFINSSNYFIGSFYTQVNSWKEFLSLAETNTTLIEENALLRQKLENIEKTDSVKLDSTILSIDPRYQFIPATVVNNSIKQKNNFITLNKGKKDGIEPDMGVISANGVVGTVLNVSENFCTVKSLLNSATKISVTIDSTNEIFGTLIWGLNNDPRYAMVRDIPNHVKVNIGQPVFTSGFSTLFPKGIKVGEIIETDLSTGGSFKDMRIAITTNFYNLTYVYIVKDKLAKEKIELESLNKNNG